MTIPFAVYTAYRGYAWSSTPDGLPAERLDGLYRKARECRPDFLDGDDFVEGVLCDGGTVMPFRMQNVPKWDAVGRAADYGAFAFLDLATVRAVDFDALLAMDAFTVPDRSPPAAIDYGGPTSVLHDEGFVKRLQADGRAGRCDFRAIGDILFTYQTCCGGWSFSRSRIHGEDAVQVVTEPWECIPEAWVRKTFSTLSRLDASAISQMLKELS